MAENSYLLLGIGFVIIFVCSESVIIYRLMCTVKFRISMLLCLKYSFIGFFFSAVTPSATGGQPMQIYYMKRDGIDVATSSVVLIIITIVYKLVLMLLSVVFGIAEFSYIADKLGNIWILILFGMLANIMFVAFLLVAIYKQSFAVKTVGKLILWLGKMHIIKNRDKSLKKALCALKKYDKSAGYIKDNRMMLLEVFVITTIQRLAMFSVTYLVYKAFGLEGHSFLQIVALQTLIALAADSLPLPGGIGATESSFLILYKDIFGKHLILPGMLLSRGISYYALIFMSAVVTLFAHLLGGRNKIIESGGD